MLWKIIFVVAMLLWAGSVLLNTPQWNRVGSACGWLAVVSLYLIGTGVHSPI
jgi:hypothetical protein